MNENRELADKGVSFFRQLSERDTKSWYRLSLASFYFLQGLIFASWASRIDIKATLGMSDAVLGMMLFCLPAGQLATMVPVGWFVGRFGSRKTIVVASTCYPIALILLGLAASTVQLASLLFLFGIFSNLSNIAVNAQAIGVERLYKLKTANGKSVLKTDIA